MIVRFVAKGSVEILDHNDAELSCSRIAHELLPAWAMNGRGPGYGSIAVHASDRIPCALAQSRAETDLIVD
jgi:hypothetical protein